MRSNAHAPACNAARNAEQHTLVRMLAETHFSVTLRFWGAWKYFSSAVAKAPLASAAWGRKIVFLTSAPLAAFVVTSICSF
jgi:hypothetical protein